jgi:CheY-like chemotaxis protein
MSCETTGAVHIPLSQQTIRGLRARAAELRHLASEARTGADIQALEALVQRFDALAERREAEENEAHRAAEALALRLIQAEHIYLAEQAAFRAAAVPSAPPMAEALQMASRALSRQFTHPDIARHPVIEAASMSLACLLTAFGLDPAHAATEPVLAQPGRPVAQIATPHPGPRHVLLVDDVTDVLVAVGAFLTNAGFTVQKASSGDEALRLVANDPQIEALVTDFAMPGLSGTELIAQAREIRPSLKAMLITAYPNADGLAELPPDTSILQKPFRRDTLIARVKSLLGTAPAAVASAIQPEGRKAIELETIDRPG